jgi:hypothetical protein
LMLHPTSSTTFDLFNPEPAPSPTPKLDLGPGDLVIVSGNIPQGKPPASNPLQQPDFAAAGKKLGYAVSPRTPKTIAGLTAAINEAVKQNGGGFRRIVIYSHAGGPENAPALNLSPIPNDRSQRINFDASAEDKTQHMPKPFSTAINNALKPSGILVLASCGSVAVDEAALPRWMLNLRGWGTETGRSVYASPGPGEADLLKGVKAYTDETRSVPVDFIGVDGKGNPIK